MWQKKKKYRMHSVYVGPSLILVEIFVS